MLDCKPHIHCSALMHAVVFVCLCVRVCRARVCVLEHVCLGNGVGAGGLSECVSAQLCLALLQ